MREVRLKGEDGADLGPYREFDEGEIVWIIVAGSMAVRCRIEHVDNYFRKQSPSAYLFYDVDEPVGHSLSEDELYLLREEAAEALEEIVADDLESALEDGPEAVQECIELHRHRTITLTDWRRANARFIVSTWGVDKLTPPRKPEDEEAKLLARYPDKPDDAWFRVDDALLAKVLHGGEAR